MGLGLWKPRPRPSDGLWSFFTNYSLLNSIDCLLSSWLFQFVLRYFLKLAYRGTPFVGWQKQPNGVSVQYCLEEAMTKVLRSPVELVGCGRTDAGVHASNYYAHFEWPDAHLQAQIAGRVNRLLPPEIAIENIYTVADDLHARYSAIRRTYHYYLIADRDPFRQDLAYTFYQFEKLDQIKMQEMAKLIRHHSAFFPFCKTHSGVEHYQCNIFEAKWTEQENSLIFEISANRFLRGMVRLIVGMSLQVGLGKVDLQTVQEALDEQKAIQRSLSAPAHGLFLSNVEYPI